MAELPAIGESTSLAERKRRAGQRLLIGLHGLTVSDDTRALLRELRPAGFVLFGRNVAAPGQVLQLTRELRGLCDEALPPLLAVDQEGGRVQRIGEPATVWPSAAETAAADRVREVHTALGHELRAMGLDWDLAPVADVQRSDGHPVIGDRAFGHRSEEVGRHVSEAVQGLQQAHVRAALKHFPGHGASPADSHETLPIVERERSELKAVDLPPFLAGIRAGADAVMAAHVVYPAWDERNPASLSPGVLGALRARFDGLILSDDIEMDALAKRYEPEEIAARGVRAGLDLFLVCHSPSLQHRLYEALVHDQERDRGYHDAAVDSLRRLTRFREATFLGVPPRPPLEAVGCDAHRSLRDEVLVRARGRA